MLVSYTLDYTALVALVVAISSESLTNQEQERSERMECSSVRELQ